MLCALAVEFPFAPRSDNLQFGRESFDRQLKTDLVVAFARCAVSNRVTAFVERNLHELFGDNRAGERRSEQIFFFVSRAGFERREDVLLDEIASEVGDENFRRAGFERFVVHDVEFVALTDVRANRNDFATVILFEPRDDNRGVQTAAVRECNFLDFVFHVVSLQKIFVR